MVLTIFDPVMTAVFATFLLVFAIVFALLGYSNIFVHKDKEGKPTEKPQRKVYALIAIVFGIFAATYEPLVVNLQQYLPLVASALVPVFIIIFIKKMMGDKNDGKFDAFPVIISLGILLLLIGIFWEEFKAYLPGDFQSYDALWIVGILIVIAIFYAVYKHKLS